MTSEQGGGDDGLHDRTRVHLTVARDVMEEKSFEPDRDELRRQVGIRRSESDELREEARDDVGTAGGKGVTLACWLAFLAQDSLVAAWSAFAVMTVGNAVGDAMLLRRWRSRSGVCIGA